MNSLDEIERRLRKRSPGKWRASDFGGAGDQEPTSIVIHTGPFNWNAIYYGPDSEEAVDWEGEVVAYMDAELYEDAELVADAPEDLEGLVKFVRAVEELRNTWWRRADQTYATDRQRSAQYTSRAMDLSEVLAALQEP